MRSLLIAAAGQRRNYNLSSDFIPVIFDIGQSNAIGRGERNRLALTTYSTSPVNVKTYWKPDYTSTDNGEWQNIAGGVNTREPSVTTLTFGAYMTLATKLRDKLNRTVYVISPGEGGTALWKNLTIRDWNQTSNECFTVATEYYFTPAIQKLQTEFPGRQIVVFKNWHQGERDASDGKQNEYYNNFVSFDAALNAYSTLLADGIWNISSIYYLLTAAETVVNQKLQQFVSANSHRAYYVDISSQPRKVDLTTAQKGGFVASTASDDEHTSYLGQVYKGEQFYNNIVSHYGLTGDDSEYLSNTNFDPSTINSGNIRLQFNRNNITRDSSNILTGITNSLTGPTFSPVNSSRFKVDQRKGWVWFDSSAANQRIETTTAVGTSLFTHSFSFSGWFKVGSPTPSANYTFIHDIQNTGSANNSRYTVFLTTTGKISIIYAVGGVVGQGTTLNAILPTGLAGLIPFHMAITLTSGGFIKVYINGTDQTMDPAVGAGGDISAVTMANYVNATNRLQIGATRTGASTYSNFYFGFMREVTVQPVVYSLSDIANLMLN